MSDANAPVDTAFRPRRSILYMPSSNAKALEKAKTLPIDAVIFDLEDAVAPDAKPAAREAAAAAVASGGYGRRTLTIRVNGVGTEWHAADLVAAAAASRAAGLASGATASSRSRITASIGSVLAFSSALALELGM